MRIVGTMLNAIVGSHIHTRKHTHTVKEIQYLQAIAIKMVNPWALRVAGQNIPGGSFSQQAPKIKCMNKLQA